MLLLLVCLGSQLSFTAICEGEKKISNEAKKMRTKEIEEKKNRERKREREIGRRRRRKNPVEIHEITGLIMFWMVTIHEDQFFSHSFLSLALQQGK